MKYVYLDKDHEVENSKEEFVLLLYELYFPKEEYSGYL